VSGNVQDQGEGRKVRLAVMLSGGGRTLQNLIDCIARGELDAEIVLVISSLSQVKGVERAEAAGLPVAVVRKKDHPDVEEFSRLIAEALDEYRPDLVCQAGWTCYWRIPDRWMGKVMNIHPALLPKHGGKGFYGHHVHEAVLAAGETASGCTVHFADNEYDAGPIILQRTVPVLPGDTADTLAERVFEQECIAYPAAIRLFIKGHLKLEGGRVLLVRPGRRPIPPKLADPHRP
jgi:formyltetrahydrofolate-dependent phosphoribosylglycinamide formyltransferase